MLAAVQRDRITLREALGKVPGPERDTPFVRELAWGTCRHFFSLDAAVRNHLRQPPRARDMDVHALLLCGLYQLQHMQVPPHAALHATVAATEQLKKGWAKGLVNGVLRNLLRNPPPEPAGAARYNLPDWWLGRLQADWPEHWEQVAAAGSARPPMTLRTWRKPQLERSQLAEAGIATEAGRLHEQAIYLEQAMEVNALPGFREGYLSVQDEGAQLAVPLLGVEPGQRVLDACAAPGGKTLQLLQAHPDSEVIALELEPERCRRIQENLERAGVQAPVLAGDGCNPSAWWDGRPFERILLDAPCSATGILRRQPDIRLLRRESDLDDLQTLQTRLLEGLWPLLQADGVLLYSTCSVMKQENAAVVAQFLARHADAEAEALPVEWGQPSGPGRQLLPTADRHDGFFFARLRKRRAG